MYSKGRIPKVESNDLSNKWIFVGAQQTSLRFSPTSSIVHFPIIYYLPNKTMKLSVFALFAFVAAALALKNDVASGDDAQAIVDGDDADEDDAAVATGIEYYQSLDDDDQAAIEAWVADQLNDDGGDDSQGGDDQGN
ncbi:Aste57867_677 [Aphanomyces stellatus]|uniref:Aste57867_677 protein n=1 Tax=Aphanomyces stellatus TaxID=120398 RepID=A0A485K5W5_9STRA|nr:hypothetical protein As57867_000676 [Aphanomyces stellatus]VFT77902.1 Aste57867_677 [Aphanomyces stellatus]